jgi:hypothetical protein
MVSHRPIALINTPWQDWPMKRSELTISSPGEASMHGRRSCASALALTCLIAACAGPRVTATATEYRVVGPENYTVDWDLPATGAYWVPKESENLIQAASKKCAAAVAMFVYHHTPRPPQYSYFGFSFDGAVDGAAQSCLIGELRAVPALTVYPKRR